MKPLCMHQKALCAHQVARKGFSAWVVAIWANFARLCSMAAPPWMRNWLPSPTMATWTCNPVVEAKGTRTPSTPCAQKAGNVTLLWPKWKISSQICHSWSKQLWIPPMGLRRHKQRLRLWHPWPATMPTPKTWRRLCSLQRAPNPSACLILLPLLTMSRNIVVAPTLTPFMCWAMWAPWLQ